MGVFHTEGYGRFKVSQDWSQSIFKGDPDYTLSAGTGAVNTQMIIPIASTTVTVESTRQSIGVFTDPTVPTKKVFGEQRVGSNAAAGARVFMKNIIFPSDKSHYFLGFMLTRVNSGAAASTVNYGTFGVTTIDLRTYQNGFPLTANYGPFSLLSGYNSDRTLASVFNNRAATGVTIDFTAPVYIEVEVDIPNKIFRVWANDMLVQDATWLAAWSTILNKGIAMFWGAMQTAANLNLDSFLVGDMYLVDANDSVFPTVRLGPTTRVVGDLPTADVQAQWTRPEGFSSNAVVVGQGLDGGKDSPDYIFADGAGTTDVYAAPNSSVGADAGSVYAMTLRVKQANFAAPARNMGALIDDGVNRIVKPNGTVTAGNGFSINKAIFVSAPDGGSWTAVKAKNSRFGVTVIS